MADNQGIIIKLLIIASLMLVTVSAARRPRNNNQDNLSHHHLHHHHHSHGQKRRSSAPSHEVDEPTAMISLVNDGRGGNKLQVSGDGQLTSYLHTLKDVPESLYSNPHIITDMDESILPQATHVHPRRDGISAIRLETSSGQLDRSSSSNNERYYDQDQESSDDVQGGDEMDDGQLPPYEESESGRKQVYYDDDSDGQGNYRMRDRRERYYATSSSRDNYYSRDGNNDQQSSSPSKSDNYGRDTAGREYVISKDYLEKERIPKEYILPVEGDGEDGTSSRVYGRHRDRETAVSDEYIHLPRNADQTYVIREREVVVPSSKDLIRDYLPLKDDKYLDKYSDMYSTADDKYSNPDVPNIKYVIDYGKKPQSPAYSLKELLKELNTGSVKMQDNQETYGSSDDDTPYNVYRDAPSVYGKASAYNVPKSDYMTNGDDDQEQDDRDSEYLHSSAAGSVGAVKEQSTTENQQQQQLQDQIVQQQIQLQQQEQIMKQELVKQNKIKQQQLAEDRMRAAMADEKKVADERRKEAEEGEKNVQQKKEKGMEEIKVELLKEEKKSKSDDKKDGRKRIVTTSSKSTVPMSTMSGSSKKNPVKKDGDLRTLRTVLSKLIRQVEDIQSATARIISGNIESLPVHNLSPKSSRAKTTRSPRVVEKKKSAPRKSQPAPAAASRQKKVMFKASDLMRLLTGDPNFSMAGARPAFPIAAMASMASATRVPAPYPMFPMPYPMFSPMSMPSYYPGPWFEDKKKKK